MPRLEAPSVVLAGSPLRLVAEIPTAGPDGSRRGELRLDGRVVERLRLEEGPQELELDSERLAPGVHTLALVSPEGVAELSIRAIPGWLSILPPLVAIALALLFRDVLLSLFAGVFTGALILVGGNPLLAFARSIDQFVVEALTDADHASILIFTMLLGGLVGLINRSGGTRGIVERLRGFATSSRRGQLTTWFMGVLVFFDDYANTLIVGSTMRPISDRLRISREKLAYIVDSTAAPIASVVPISTWIGFEVGLIAGAFRDLQLPFNAFVALVGSIPYRFYPILALVMGFAIALTGRDFGPMLRAERRAAREGKVLADDAVPLADVGAQAAEPPSGAPLRAINALGPILTVVVLVVAGLWVTGSAALGEADLSGLARVREVFAEANSFQALLWASLAGVVVALVLPVTQRILTWREGTAAMVDGFRSMLLALAVLVLAWSIGAACDTLQTAEFVVGLTEGVLSVQWLPVLTFVIAAAVAFATGTSWGTMAILMPLVIPVAHGLSLAAGHAVEDPLYYTMLLGTISSVLAGSVWGDHCSPISDTTILSSVATGSDHIAHVRTQLPYALAVGVVAMAVGDIPTAWGLSPWISLTLGSTLVVGGLLWLGQRADD